MGRLIYFIIRDVVHLQDGLHLLDILNDFERENVPRIISLDDSINDPPRRTGQDGFFIIYFFNS